MWLRNFDLACAASQANNGGVLPSAEGAVAGEDGYNYVHQMSGAWYNVRISNGAYFPYVIDCDGYPTEFANKRGFMFGSGTTAATYDDYCLENAITSGFNFAQRSKTVVYDTTSKKFVTTLTADYTNTTSGDVVVSEVGYGGLFSIDNSSGRNYLLLREVLDTPVTVHAGQYIRVTLSYEVGAYPNKPTVTATTV